MLVGSQLRAGRQHHSLAVSGAQEGTPALDGKLDEKTIKIPANYPSQAMPPGPEKRVGDEVHIVIQAGEGPEFPRLFPEASPQQRVKAPWVTR